MRAAGEPAIRAPWNCAPGRPMPPDAGRTPKARKEAGDMSQENMIILRGL